MSESSFAGWFRTVTGHTSPHAWQEALAQSHCRDLLIRIPTGLGKTEGVLAAWSFHRVCQGDSSWPRRLVWCLPMRVLVEQTEQVARQLVAKISTAEPPNVYVAMGGEDIGEWFLYPEHPAIIVGTQDMLLSRALNRGYASGRARWPMEFGLLSQDALWIMDEVQLMDVGLATSAQLQAFRAEDRDKDVRPCHTWWMSATLQPEWLKSVDTAAHYSAWIQSPCTVVPADRKGGPWDGRKSLATAAIGIQDHKTLAERIIAAHRDIPATQYGRITLVICNTVDRARRTFDALRNLGRSEGLELIHSRFRPAERDSWRDRFLSRFACTPEVNRIIIATQVVEAGVDISATCLITELAAWPSLVQRFGRCARFGGDGHVLVIDRGRDQVAAAPYNPEELNSAWEALEALRSGVGIDALETYEESLDRDARSRLYPFSPKHLLLRAEFDELFDTTPDLTGADLDISRFIRSGDERDLQIFWLDIGKSDLPSAKRRAQRRELCSVPFLTARDWLCGEETKTSRKPKLRSGVRAWVWDWIEGEWIAATREALLPGRVVCVAAQCGGYDTHRGFDPESKRPVAVVPLPMIPPYVKAFDEADDHQDGENLSFEPWKTIGYHCSEVANEAKKIADKLCLTDELRDILIMAGQWHDWGKSHPAFQGAMRAADRPLRCDLAKAPEQAWLQPPSRMYRYQDGTDERAGFRHELASALGLFALLQMYEPRHPALLGPWTEMLTKIGRQPDLSDSPAPPETSVVQQLLNCSAEAFDLLTYLVASHHGKVRVGLHAAPKDQEYRDRDGRGLPIRGVREGDCLPAVVLAPDTEPVPQVALTLSPASIGLSERTGMSWRERCLRLLDRFGPGGLAFLESLLRAADIRASRLKTNDPTLMSETNA